MASIKGAGEACAEGLNRGPAVLQPRVYPTDIGKLKTPSGGGSTAGKGSIAQPKPVGK